MKYKKGAFAHEKAFSCKRRRWWRKKNIGFFFLLQINRPAAKLWAWKMSRFNLCFYCFIQTWPEMPMYHIICLQPGSLPSNKSFPYLFPPNHFYCSCVIHHNEITNKNNNLFTFLFMFPFYILCIRCGCIFVINVHKKPVTRSRLVRVFCLIALVKVNNNK